jgi:hypothetical protein
VDEFSIPEHETSVIYYYIFQWVNSVFLVEHEMGHLPFEAEIQDIVKYGSFNFVTVAVNNTLTPNIRYTYFPVLYVIFPGGSV